MPIETRLERFIKSHGLKPLHIARKAGCSRKHLHRIRTGRAEPTLRVIRAITRAVRSLEGRTVRVTELFSLGDGEK